MRDPHHVAKGSTSDYTLSSDGPCFRTEVVARVDVLDKRRWLGYIAGTWTDENDTQNTREDSTEVVAGARVARWIAHYWNEAHVALKYLEKVDVDGLVFHGNAYAKDVLISRWEQIERMCAEALVDLLEYDELVQPWSRRHEHEPGLVALFPALEERLAKLKQ